jgi:hypothetical protein
VLSGVPGAQWSRVARIFRPAKTTTQSGSFNAREWEISFDTQQRWQNPLMGWASTCVMSYSSFDSTANIAYCFLIEVILSLPDSLFAASDTRTQFRSF